MTTRTRTRLDELREHAAERQAEWDAQHEAFIEQGRLDTRFAKLSPIKILDMWEYRVNEKGQKLTQWETEALVEAFCREFGELPPQDGEPARNHKHVEPEPLPDDTALSAEEVAEKLGVSLATLKRRVQDGTFPQPIKISNSTQCLDGSGRPAVSGRSGQAADTRQQSFVAPTLTQRINLPRPSQDAPTHQGDRPPAHPQTAREGSLISMGRIRPKSQFFPALIQVGNGCPCIF